MTLEKCYLAVHGSENKHHCLWSSERFAFLPDLAEVHLFGTPSLIEISNLPAIELGFAFVESDKIRLR
jgi:hypothetical protein